jgi:hypothetical protein
MQPFLQWKTTSIALSERVFLALDIQDAVHMRHIVISGLSSSTIFFSYYLINGKIFEKKRYKTRNACFDFL